MVCKRIIKLRCVPVVLAITLLPSFCSAEVQDFLWTASVLPYVNPIHVELSDNAMSVNATVNSQDWTGTGTILAEYHNACDTQTYVSGQKTAWLLTPKQFESHGITFFVIPQSGTGWHPNQAGAAEPAGYTARVFERRVNNGWFISTCFAVGQQFGGVVFAWSPMIYNISINKSHAIPGTYSVNIPVKYAYEEAKSNESYITSFSGTIPQLMLQLAPTINIPLTVTIRSKCKLSNYSPIDLSYGTVSADQINGYTTPPQNLSLTCDSNTPVKISLKGNEQISGRTSNFTRCGSNGFCELLFNGSKYDESMTISGSSTISLTSVYHLADGSKVTAGPFSGSGILTVDVQ